MSLKLPLALSYFAKETPFIPLIQARIPALRGLHQDKPWVGILRKLTEVGYDSFVKKKMEELSMCMTVS